MSEANSGEDILRSIEAFADKSIQNAKTIDPWQRLKYTIVQEPASISVAFSPIGHSTENRNRKKFGWKALNEDEKSALNERIHVMLKQKHMAPSPETHQITTEYIEAALQVALDHLTRDANGVLQVRQSDKSPAAISGIYETRIIYPSTKQKSITNATIIVSFRDVGDEEKIKTSYILEPISLRFNSGAKDKTSASEVEEKTKIFLNSKGWKYGKLSQCGYKPEKKRVPLQWINQDQVRLINSSSSKNYQILIVPMSTAKRYPEIKWSTETDDLEIAQARLDAFKNEFLPTCTTDFSLNELSQWMDTHVPLPKKKKITRPPRNSLMELSGPSRNSNSEVFLVSRTPTVLQTYSNGEPVNFQCALGYCPVNRSSNRSSNYSALSACFPTNTNCYELAVARAEQLQKLAAGALLRWKAANPDITIATESAPGKPDRFVFVDRAIGEEPPPGKIFFKTLREEVIKPISLEFERMIAWQVTRENQADGKVKLTLQAIRNDNEPIPEPLLVEWAGPHNVMAANAAAADVFEHTLHDAMFAEQHPDSLFSRERPVEHYGAPSQRVSTRESLRAALVEHPEIDTLGSNTLPTLREPNVAMPSPPVVQPNNPVERRAGG